MPSCFQYHKNEDIGIGMVRSALPKYGYTNNQIDKIVQIINATKLSVEPSSLLEQIMCDADHDYIGRPEYHIIAKKLREELALNKKVFTEREWIEFQLEFLENQHVANIVYPYFEKDAPEAAANALVSVALNQWKR